MTPSSFPRSGASNEPRAIQSGRVRRVSFGQSRRSAHHQVFVRRTTGPATHPVLVADLGRAACDGVSIAALGPVFPDENRGPCQQNGRRHRPSGIRRAGTWTAAGSLPSCRSQTYQATLSVRPTPVPQQMPWSRRWTARGGGHRLNLLARLPKGWQMRDVDRTRRQAAARCAPVVMPPPFPTDLLAGAPTLSPKPKEVNIDH